MKFRAKYLMNVCLMAITAYVFISALEWPLKASLFPMVITVPVFFMALGDLVMNLAGGWKKEKKSVMDFKLSEEVDKKVALRRTLITAGWIFAFFLMIVLLGFPASVPLFVFCYLKFQAREEWKTSFLITIAIWAAFWGLFIWLLQTQFPKGWLF